MGGGNQFKPIKFFQDFPGTKPLMSLNTEVKSTSFLCVVCPTYVWPLGVFNQILSLLHKEVIVFTCFWNQLLDEE